MTPAEALHSAAGTSHCVAAAETSIVRALAPDLRRYSCEVRMPALPPVDIAKHPQQGHLGLDVEGLHAAVHVQLDHGVTAGVRGRGIAILVLPARAPQGPAPGPLSPRRGRIRSRGEARGAGRAPPGAATSCPS